MREELKRKQALEIQQEEERKLLSNLIGKYQNTVVHFPPEDFKENIYTIYTYELQLYFNNQASNYIEFRGYLEDIVRLNNDIFVEFSCPIINKSVFSVISPTIVVFYLKINEKQATDFLKVERADSINKLLGFFRDPDHIVVAKVHDVHKARIYKFTGSPAGEEEVKINIETQPKFVANGVLIDVVNITKSPVK